MFLNQGTRQPEASQEEKVNGDMASVWEELDDVQLATVSAGATGDVNAENFSLSVRPGVGAGGIGVGATINQDIAANGENFSLSVRPGIG